MLLDDNEILFIIALVVILILILIMIGLINCATANDYPLTTSYVEASDMETGDLVCVAYDNIAGSFVSSFSNSIWSHTGTIWVDPESNVRYVLEGAIYRHKDYREFFKIPYETWLYFNRKNLTGYLKRNGNPIDSNFMWSKFEPYVKCCKLESANIFWSRFLFEKDYYEYQKNYKYTCIEMTVILGQECEIFEKDKIYCSYYPGQIVNNQIKCVPGVYYSNVVKIKIQPSDMMLLTEDIKNNTNFWKN